MSTDAGVGAPATPEPAKTGPDPTDRRRNLVTLTATGRRHLRKLDNILADVEAEVFAPLTQAQRTELTKLLTLLVTHHEDNR